MKYIVKKPVKLFDQIERYGEITNVLGFGDPHVEKVDGAGGRCLSAAFRQIS
ncbi:MAG: hypothetical protein ACQEUD_19015 [Bacillota bacterium]